MSHLTPGRLLLLAVVVTLASADGLYRAWRQRTEERIGRRVFILYAVALVAGSSLAWAGFLVSWLEG
jgi:hypothetical protein